MKALAEREDWRASEATDASPVPESGGAPALLGGASTRLNMCQASVRRPLLSAQPNWPNQSATRYHLATINDTTRGRESE